MKCTLNIALFFLLAIPLLIYESASANEAERDIHAEDSLAEKILFKTFPEKYWRKRIKDIEENIASERSYIRDMRYDLDILKSTAKLEIQKAAHWARSEGGDPGSAAAERREEVRRDIHDLKMSISEERLYLQRDLRWLEIAKHELKREVDRNQKTAFSDQKTKELEQNTSAPSGGYRDPELDKIFGIEPDAPSKITHPP